MIDPGEFWLNTRSPLANESGLTAACAQKNVTQVAGIECRR
jgi:hypothetical protein